MTVIIYSTPSCVYCKMAKEYFKDHGITYAEHDISADPDKRKEMVEKSGQLGVPVIDIDGQIMVGFDEETFESLLNPSDASQQSNTENTTA